MEILYEQQPMTVPQATKLIHVLAALEGRASAEQKMISEVTLDGTPIVPDDLVPHFLNRPIQDGQRIAASTMTLATVVQKTKKIGEALAAQCAQEGAQLVIGLRGQLPIWPHLSQWLGKVADLLEFQHNEAQYWTRPSQDSLLSGILNQVLAAQQRHDATTVADLLEYELLPRLAHNSDDETASSSQGSR